MSRKNVGIKKELVIRARKMKTNPYASHDNENYYQCKWSYIDGTSSLSMHKGKSAREVESKCYRGSKLRKGVLLNVKCKRIYV